jgi:hypothetical protein
MAVTLKDGTVKYAGMVVEAYWQEVRVMSDVWEQEWRAVAMDYNEDGDIVFVHIPIGVTGFGPIEGSCEIDAAPELLALYKEYLAKCKSRSDNMREAEYEISNIRRSIADLTCLARGKNVKVVKGRKVPLGTEGQVIWIGPDQFHAGKVRIGLKDVGGVTHWTAGDNVKVMLDSNLQAAYDGLQSNLVAAQARYTSLSNMKVTVSL